MDDGQKRKKERAFWLAVSEAEEEMGTRPSAKELHVQSPSLLVLTPAGLSVGCKIRKKRGNERNQRRQPMSEVREVGNGHRSPSVFLQLERLHVVPQGRPPQRRATFAPNVLKFAAGKLVSGYVCIVAIGARF